MGFVDDYWITPEGVAPMGASEHAQYALEKMSGVYVPKRYIWLIPDEYLRQMPQDIQNYLLTPGADPRKYACQHYGWVRVAKNGTMNMWKLDSRTLSMIRNAKDFWRAQYNTTEFSIAEIEELSTRAHFSISVGDLLSSKTPGELKGVGEEPEAPEPVRYYGRSGPQTGETWQYRTKGDNPGEDVVPEFLDEPFEITRCTGEQVRYEPRGAVEIAENPYKHIRSEEPIWQAQFMIGLNVNGKTVWKAEQIRKFFIAERKKQLGSGAEYGGSVFPVMGWWGVIGSGYKPEEPSVSVMIESLSGEKTKHTNSKGVHGVFPQRMIAIAEKAVTVLRQSCIILRFSENGLIREQLKIEEDKGE